MAKGFKHGSGSLPLNFKVVGGTTEHSNPKENMLWVNTDVKISGYYFTTTQPQNMAEGEVWFYSKPEYSTKFNALKKNTLEVGPVSAKQMVSGELKEVEAKIYQNGQWKGLTHDLYLLGPDGYDAQVITTYRNGGNVGNATISVGEKSITLASTFVQTVGGAQVALTFNKKYDLTHYNTLEINVDTVFGTEGSAFCAINTDSAYIRGSEDAANLWLTNQGKRSLDISNLSGEYYIHLYIESYPGTVGYKVDEIVLKA